jgi:DNA excision repair protein ERCC-2
MYSQILSFEPISVVNYSYSYARAPVLPVFIARGHDQTSLSTQPILKENFHGINNYGRLLTEIAEWVPDGVAVFFPSFHFLDEILKMWRATGIVGKILDHKLLFLEPQTESEASLMMDNYKRAVATARGAMWLGVSNGRASEGVDFSGPYGRCLIVLGLPEPEKTDLLLKTRSEYLDLHFQVTKEDFLLFNALRIVTQCFAKVLSSKQDYGIVLFADARFDRPNAKLKLPQWIRDLVMKDQVNQTVDDAVEHARAFCLKMSQPYVGTREAVSQSDQIVDLPA